MIEEIAKRTADVLPRYGSTYWALLTQPVTQTVPRSRQGKLVWDAVLFWTVSLAVYLLTRYIAFSSGADPVLFFVARGISSLLQLVLVSLAFFWVWRLFGSGLGLGSFLIATACIHGVVLPLEAVLNLGSIGVARIIDEDLYRQAVNSLNGCGQIMTFTELEAAVQSWVDGNPDQPMKFILLYIVVTLPLIIVLVAFSVVFARVLGQLAPERRRTKPVIILLMLMLGALLAVIGLFFTTLFDWILFNDPNLCIQPGPKET